VRGGREGGGVRLWGGGGGAGQWGSSPFISDSLGRNVAAARLHQRDVKSVDQQWRPDVLLKKGLAATEIFVVRALSWTVKARECEIEGGSALAAAASRAS